MISERCSFRIVASGLPIVLGFFLCSASFAQRVAFIAPDRSSQSVKFSEALEDSLQGKLHLVDRAMSEAALSSVSVADHFNLTIAEAKHIGSVIGSQFFVLVRSANQRRSSLERDAYYESYGIIYLVSSRTGRLVLWKLVKGEAATVADAERVLFESTAHLANEISEQVRIAAKVESSEKPPPELEEMPAETSPDDRTFRGPVPYLRIKPEYTSLAYLYDVKATIDISVDLGRDGKILRAEIVRWAGFGLDRSVEDAVRKMNWRPAERGGKQLQMRVLLRYNFKKIEKDATEQ